MYMIVSTISSGVTYYVDAAKPAGGNGLSWATAFNTLQAAVNAANPVWMQCYAPLDTIYVKQGTYVLTSTLTLGSGDELYGGFPSSIANPVWADRDWKTYPTVIDGNNSVRCVTMNHYSMLDGFTIQNGSASTGAGISVGATPIDCGFLGYMSPIVQNCRIRNNTSSGSAGGLFDDGADVHILDCEFSGNSAGGSGGAIYYNNSGTEILRCTFYNNETTPPGSLGGGATAGFGHNGTTGEYVTITNCLFYANVSNSWGGAISGNQVYPTITNCTFADNEASINGGAFHGNVNSEAPRIRNSICWGNSPDELNIVTASTYLDVSYCDIQGGWTGAGSNNINQNPLFKGGTNYRLQMGSPCIDTGSDAYAPDDDLDGQSRPQDGNNDGTPRADMGAYEAEYTNVDLSVLAITKTPYYPRAGESMSVTVSARNSGTTEASSFYLDWYANRASAPGVNQYGDQFQKFSSLAGGTTTSMTKNYTYSAPGVYSMYAQADTDQQVEETNEGNNVLGPQSVKVIDGDLLDFDLREESHNASHWFGGDNRPASSPRNVGVGQSIILAREAWVQSAGFYFGNRFDYMNNPDGVGHAVRLYLNVRNSSGTILRTVYRDLPASFEGGWVMFPFGSNHLWLNAEQEYIFTCYLYKGEIVELKSSAYGRTDDPWPLSSGYTCTVDSSPADMTSWANWGASAWDFNFRITGQYVEPYPGDLNSDWTVGINDAAILAGNWLRDDCLMLDWCDGCDMNWSKKVELTDFAVLSAYWKKSFSPPAYSTLDRDIIAKIYQYGHLSSTSIDASDGSEFKPGTYCVYRTSQGRLGKFIVENWEPAMSYRLTIAWVTYNANGTVYSSGSGLVIKGSYHCDLDTGAETPTGADFQWNTQTSSTRYLVPKNSALFKLIYREP